MCVCKLASVCSNLLFAYDLRGYVGLAVQRRGASCIRGCSSDRDWLREAVLRWREEKQHPSTGRHAAAASKPLCRAPYLRSATYTYAA